ncbi:Hypothetical predicted protein [Paramuricea clavata]|uniref:Uncharacterized protein n=1 Tax=Paramuricea clavata TaxID=317549 RepID=A0A7D9DKA4_PARCT|nr:Hypothetical predicted protein [Paramuricea clavata]
MAEVNSTYVSILNRYRVQISETANYRKHLKKLLSERLPSVQFVKSLCKNEPDRIVLPRAVSKGIELRCSLMDNSETIGRLKNIADILHKEMIQHRKIGRSTAILKNSRTLHSFCFFSVISSLVAMFSKLQEFAMKRWIKLLMLLASFLSRILEAIARVRDKSLIDNLSEVYIGSDYKKILELEKHVEQSVLQRMKETVDNIDLLEDTPTGQNTFHGTVIVLNQQAEDGEPVNPPLVLPDKLLSPAPNLISNDFHHTWALANYFGTDDDDDETPESRHVENEEEQVNEEEQQIIEDQEGEVDRETARNLSDSILSVKEPIRKSKKLAKEVMPTWAATKSLLLSHTSPKCVVTNSEVISPLFKTSPTDYTTLHTVLMLTQGISAWVGPERKTLITLDLDLYNRALQIQQTVGNTNWILRAGILHIVFAALHALGKTIYGSGIDTCAIKCGIYTSAALHGIYRGKAYKRSVEYHITTSLAIMMMSPEMIEIYDNIQSWYSANIKPHEDKEDNGDFAQFLMQYLEQVNSLLHIINACRSGDWEGYLAVLENVIK